MISQSENSICQDFIRFHWHQTRNACFLSTFRIASLVIFMAIEQTTQGERRPLDVDNKNNVYLLLSQASYCETFNFYKKGDVKSPVSFKLHIFLIKLTRVQRSFAVRIDCICLF